MPSPLDGFLTEAKRLTKLVRSEDPIDDARLEGFVANRRRLDFLEGLIGHFAIVTFCYESLCRLTEQLWRLDARKQALPIEPGRGSLRYIPAELAAEEEGRLVEGDALTSLLYYEVTTVVSMLRQVGVAVDPASEIQYMTKVRDRFLAHSRLTGVARGVDSRSESYCQSSLRLLRRRLRNSRGRAGSWTVR
jgi:hypothetical protein